MRSTTWIGMMALLAACGAAEGDSAAKGDASAPRRTAARGEARDADSAGRQVYDEACVMCHGEGGRGTPLGSALADAEWKHAQGGTAEEIARVVREGVPPPDSSATMPPMPAHTTLTDEQVRGVAEYVQSLAR